MSWSDVFDRYQSLVTEEIRNRRRRPLSSLSGVLQEGAEWIDLRHMNSERIEMMPDPTRPFEHPRYNSGLPNGSKMRRSLFVKLEKMVAFLDALAPNFGYAAGQI